MPEEEEEKEEEEEEEEEEEVVSLQLSQNHIKGWGRLENWTWENF